MMVKNSMPRNPVSAPHGLATKLVSTPVRTIQTRYLDQNTRPWYNPHRAPPSLGYAWRNPTLRCGPCPTPVIPDPRVYPYRPLGCCQKSKWANACSPLEFCPRPRPTENTLQYKQGMLTQDPTLFQYLCNNKPNARQRRSHHRINGHALRRR